MGANPSPLALSPVSRYFPPAAAMREKTSRGDSVQQPVCPKCSSDFVKRVSRVGFEHLMSVFYIYPFRCEPCGQRFRILQWGVTYTKIELDKTLDRSGSEKQPTR